MRSAPSTAADTGTGLYGLRSAVDKGQAPPGGRGLELGAVRAAVVQRRRRQAPPELSPERPGGGSDVSAARERQGLVSRPDGRESPLEPERGVRATQIVIIRQFGE